MPTNEEIKHAVMHYDNKYEQGLTSSEFNDILKTLRSNDDNFSLEKFCDSLNGNTCGFIDGKIVNYFHDVIVAMICGFENRDLTLEEFD